MREITTHEHPDLPPSQLSIEAFGTTGYIVRGPRAEQADLQFLGTYSLHQALLTNEALLAIVMDRLTQFQAGEQPCHENARALLHLRDAMDALHERALRQFLPPVEPTQFYEGPDHGPDA